MKTIKLLFLLLLMALFTACGTDVGQTTPTRFDMWEYMTSSTDYRVQYRVYENDTAVDYEIENHRMYDDKYERDGNDGLITLTTNSATILMVEPLQDVRINRYLHLGDNNVFRGELIDNCTLKQFYRDYETKGIIFHNVVRVDCKSVSGVKQEYYYGYNEGLVSLYKNDGEREIELVKINESRL